MNQRRPPGTPQLFCINFHFSYNSHFARAAEEEGPLEATLSTLRLALRFCFVGRSGDWSKIRKSGGWAEEEVEVEGAIILVGVEGQL